MDLFGEEPQQEIEETVPMGMVANAPEDLFTHPREQSFYQGHEDIEENFITLFEQGRIPHGLIFSGIKGIGKAGMAYRLARYALKHGGHDPNQDSLFGDAPALPSDFNIDPQDLVFRKVASRGHPDLFTVERAYDDSKNRYKQSVEVDEIRKITPFLRMTSSEGGWRVVIVDDADTMNRNAQNAILKILEEPPKNSLLILVTHRLGALIPTIRSRTRTIHFDPLEQSQLEEMLAQSDMDVSPSDIPKIAAMAQGSFGKALDYAESGALETLGTIVNVLNQYPKFEAEELHKLADQLGRAGKDQAYEDFTTLMNWAFSSLALDKGRGLNITNPALANDNIQSWHKKMSLEQLLKICENLSEHFIQVQRSNLDKRHGVLGAFSIIKAA